MVLQILSHPWKCEIRITTLEYFVAFESESRSVMSDSLRPHGLYSPWNSPGQNTGVGSLSLLQDLPNPNIEHRSPTLQTDSFPTELWNSTKPSHWNV